MLRSLSNQQNSTAISLRKTPLVRWMSDHAAVLGTEQARRRAVLLALSLSENTPLAPQSYERMLLERFIRGELTLNQVITQHELRGHQ